MNRPKRGFHLIFAQENFDEKSGLWNPDNPNDNGKRNGTEADVKALVKAYTHLGFKNVVFQDQSKEEIKKILDGVSSSDLTNHDCIAVTMLTHGNMDELFARDGSFPADEVWQPFQADKCKSLAGKPKIFICQACKGTKKNPGAELDKNKLQSDGSNVRIGTQTDFIWGFSTCRGEVSYRHCKEGSIYIQALCNVILGDSKRTMDFASILLMANRETNTIFNEKEDYKGYMQCPNYTNTLLGKVKFPLKKKFPVNVKATTSSLPLNEAETDIHQAFAKISLASSQVPPTTAEGQSAHDAQNTWV
jgi:caspase-like apoptosis-related cysteine protease